MRWDIAHTLRRARRPFESGSDLGCIFFMICSAQVPIRVSYQESLTNKSPDKSLLPNPTCSADRCATTFGTPSHEDNIVLSRVRGWDERRR